ncbi:translesion DNA synthesis-associated protein ImuA [Aquabacterium sp. A7-Y]|uniref:translesion DNA synthesis-associated protein ImuA n=1 Tax=Aquabacterium sp. A7-Y TaxID=1349605 RepID=UPI00223CA50E|nr:translesion DNA synthesis-associated protein ImuA [Aquabacterium sp. A7-Y]MCW7536999.1 translesion DNA synthesis-associated protein ImuA [Aquabacterium sp. A7-Y]
MDGVPPGDRLVLPAGIESAVWRGDQMAEPPAAVLPSGHAALDAELPGGGWPCGALTELLQPQPGVFEWRLLGPALRARLKAGGSVVLVAPPQHPHLPGLRKQGLDPRRLVWVEAATPAERLWATEQVIKSNPEGAVLAWLPQLRPEQVRRLQVWAQQGDAPVFLFRPASAQLEASAAPLRLLLALGDRGSVQLQVLKRRGPVHDGVVELDSVQPALGRVLAHRFRAATPASLPLSDLEHSNAVLAGSDTFVSRSLPVSP